MTQEAAGWAESWTRRQLLIRGGGAFVGASALGGLLSTPEAALADPPGALTPGQLSVAGALASAILIAARQSRQKPGSRRSALVKPGSGSDPTLHSPQALQSAGLQPPQAIAGGYAALDPVSRATISEMLDAIDAAPSSPPGTTILLKGPSPGTFASLSDSQRQEFIPKALAPFAPPPASEAQLAALNALSEAASVFFNQHAGQLLQGGTQALPRPPQGGTHAAPPAQIGPPTPAGAPAQIVAPLPPGLDLRGSGSPPTFAVTPPLTAAKVLAHTLLAGLRLVSAPLTPPPAPPQPPPIDPLAVASLIAKLRAGVPAGDLPQSLIDQLTAGVQSTRVQSAPPPLPAAVLDDALGLWLLGA